MCPVSGWGVCPACALFGGVLSCNSAAELMIGELHTGDSALSVLVVVCLEQSKPAVVVHAAVCLLFGVVHGLCLLLEVLGKVYRRGCGESMSHDPYTWCVCAPFAWRRHMHSDFHRAGHTAALPVP